MLIQKKQIDKQWNAADIQLSKILGREPWLRSTHRPGKGAPAAQLRTTSQSALRLDAPKRFKPAVSGCQNRQEQQPSSP
ncbi:hypothetical protein PGQ11_009756 [Apiospora arundinis]|uniref:Uncharacterized protein n=1 Tax=Apiospora arundinis TaxID=335852 RepID=A0ABR2I7D8_9PEZI